MKAAKMILKVSGVCSALAALVLVVGFAGVL